MDGLEFSGGKSKLIHSDSEKRIRKILYEGQIESHNVKFVMILASNAKVVVPTVHIFLVVLSANQMGRVTFSFRENLNVVNLH